MRLLTAKELEKELQVTRQTLYRYRKAGMPCIEMGPRFIRFELDKVLEWLKEYK